VVLLIVHWIDISWWEKVVRTIVVYTWLVLLLRVLGKRTLAQLNSLDLVVLLLLSNVVQNAIIGPDNSLFGGLLGAAVLLAFNYVLVRFAFPHPMFQRLLQGTRLRIVSGGRPDRATLRRELISEEQLDGALRREGVENGVAGAKEVWLEPDGALTPIVEDDRTSEILRRLERIEQRLAR
jgi:uncharacterized membrane protein YcaP (DUF421 family)